jgi:hypothetical protein
MSRIRQSRLWVQLLLVISATAGLTALAGSWLPLLAAAPWLGAIVCFASRGDAADVETPPSAAEAARRRLSPS